MSDINSIINNVVNKKLSQREAAKILDLTLRKITSLCNWYRIHGSIDASLIQVFATHNEHNKIPRSTHPWRQYHKHV